eukprot:102304-Prorocentrum_minimum.AAC.1
MVPATAPPSPILAPPPPLPSATPPRAALRLRSAAAGAFARAIAGGDLAALPPTTPFLTSLPPGVPLLPPPSAPPPHPPQNQSPSGTAASGGSKQNVCHPLSQRSHSNICVASPLLPHTSHGASSSLPPPTSSSLFTPPDPSLPLPDPLAPAPDADRPRSPPPAPARPTTYRCSSRPDGVPCFASSRAWARAAAPGAWPVNPDAVVAVASAVVLAGPMRASTSGGNLRAAGS